MRASIPTTLLLASMTAATYTCLDFNIPISLTTPALPPIFPPFQNQQQAVAFLSNLTQRNAATTLSPPFADPTNITVTASIQAQYCTPSTTTTPTIVQILTHGLGFDLTYWSLISSTSPYNYILSATAANYATLSYSRLGNGNSTITNPYTTQQLGVETAILAYITTLLRHGGLSSLAGSTIPVPQKVVHVGHSFGSSISHALIASAPQLSDGVVLTGYSTSAAYAAEFLISSNMHIAKEADPTRFAAYESTGWLTWGDAEANQYSFFHFPAFETEVLEAAEAGKMPYALSEFLTVVPVNASGFEGPVLVIAGEYDRIFCGAWCHGILQKAKPYFLGAKPFKTYIQPDTGHGMNLHLNASGFYEVVNSFIAANVGI